MPKALTLTHEEHWVSLVPGDQIRQPARRGHLDRADGRGGEENEGAGRYRPAPSGISRA